MKSLIKKDQKIRNKYFLSEFNQKITKFAFREFLNDSFNNTNNKQKFAKTILSKFEKGVSKTKIVRRCVLTGRSRSSLRFSGISRIKLKELIRDKQIRNINKQSW